MLTFGYSVNVDGGLHCVVMARPSGTIEMANIDLIEHIIESASNELLKKIAS